ncbi:M23 family metallopeptidase [Glycomyces sp. NPDC046736]|uniref:M23 family metallopeptidase n=1 Tax=Glycomyces sp. NPDC046736 TaxID=3155615 RepID=UPI003401B3D0
MKRLIAIGAVLTVVMGGSALLMVGAADQHRRHFAIGTGSDCALTDADLEAVAASLGSGFGTTQAAHAITIYQTAADRDLPEQAAVVALATAMQESTIRVLANPAVPESYDYDHDGEGVDHDSIGIFQQRPHWGPVATLMDPARSAGLFYDALVEVGGWESLPVTVAAQRVQVSAFPDAYADDEPGARAAVATIREVLACEWTHPVAGHPINSGWRTAERPQHNGVDLAAPRGTAILAASGGDVVTVVCNARTPAGRPYTCDIDGSPEIFGCGWYVEIAHAENLLTRYCHLGSRPEVTVGDTVAAGDLLGYVGSSGRSSGPHLHLEVHRSHNPNFDTALSPVDFFASKEVEL